MSTAIALMVASGVLIGVNLRWERMQLYRRDGNEEPVTQLEAQSLQLQPGLDEGRFITFQCSHYYGWPFPALERVRTCYFIGAELREDRTFYIRKGWIKSGVALNVACALLILTVLGIAIELEQRRREKK